MSCYLWSFYLSLFLCLWFLYLWLLIQKLLNLFSIAFCGKISISSFICCGIGVILYLCLKINLLRRFCSNFSSFDLLIQLNFSFSLNCFFGLFLLTTCLMTYLRLRSIRFFLQCDLPKCFNLISHIIYFSTQSICLSSKFSCLFNHLSLSIDCLSSFTNLILGLIYFLSQSFNFLFHTLLILIMSFFIFISLIILSLMS